MRTLLWHATSKLTLESNNKSSAWFILYLNIFHYLQVGKNASKCTKKRLNDDNAQTFPSFCFYSRADDGGDIREFEEVSRRFDRSSNVMNNST